MMKCKFYSDYIEGAGECCCSYDKVNYNGPILLCTHKDEEDNCTCFEPKEQKIEINLKEIRQDAVIQFANLVNKKLDYYNRRSIKLSAFYLSSMMKEALHELGYEG